MTRTLALLLGIVFTKAALYAQSPAVVSGVVRDENNVPVREALIVVDPDSLSLRTRTGVDGRYRITVPPGRYEVRVVRIGFKPQSHTIVIAGQPVELDIVLQSVAIPLDTVAVRAARPGLYGVVVTRGINLLPHEPRPLRSAHLEVLNEPHNAQTGSDGRFSMPQLSAGSHTVVVTLDRYVTRLIPITIPEDGGVEITVTLDSLYAEYQRRDEDQLRGISWRARRATSPATIVPLHEIDIDAKDLREGIRYSNSLLSRGLRIYGACIYLNGQPRTEVALQDIDPKEVEALEVYPANTLGDRDRLPLFPKGTPCEGLWAAPLPGRGPTSRVPLRNRGNQMIAIMVWTRGRR